MLGQVLGWGLFGCPCTVEQLSLQQGKVCLERKKDICERSPEKLKIKVSLFLSAIHGRGPKLQSVLCHTHIQSHPSRCLSEDSSFPPPLGFKELFPIQGSI